MLSLSGMIPVARLTAPHRLHHRRRLELQPIPRKRKVLDVAARQRQPPRELCKDPGAPDLRHHRVGLRRKPQQPLRLEERRIEHQHALAPLDHELIAAIPIEAAAKLGLGAANEVEAEFAAHVDAGFRGHGATRNLRRTPQEMQRQRQRIDAEVERSAAAEIGPEEAALRALAAPVGKLGLDPPDLADRPVLNQPLGSPDRGQEAGPHSLHREAVFGGRFAANTLGVDDGCRQRLFDEHGLPGCDCAQRLLGMQCVWRRDVDHFDARVCEHGIEFRVGPLGPEFSLECLRLPEVARADADERGVRQQGEIGGKLARYAARSDNSPCDGPAHAPLRPLGRELLCATGDNKSFQVGRSLRRFLFRADIFLARLTIPLTRAYGPTALVEQIGLNISFARSARSP